MFIVTQIIGLLVVNSYLPKQELIFNETSGQYENVTIVQPLPYGMQPPEIPASQSLISIIFSFAIAIILLLILAKYKWKFFIRGWFFLVVALALAIAFNSLLKYFSFYSYIIALIIAVPIAYFKIYRPSILVHNFTELLIYPGIAAVFVPILNVWTVFFLLILISGYDMWAVWHSGIMQKMAKFQMNELKVFGGFLVPYMSKKVKQQIANLKKLKSRGKGKKIRINLAILGGGDVVFPIITSGIFLKFYGVIPALFVVAGATLALLFLFALSEKKKFYPAMPFITSGILLALLIWRILLLF